MMYFKNRQDAGQGLAEKLLNRRGKNAAVLALPRWWVPVGYEIAKALHLPLDTLVVRKLGVIFNPEFAFGAIAEGGVMVVDQKIVEVSAMSEKQVESIVQMERAELERRKKEYRSGKVMDGHAYDEIILVDDGLATGTTMEAAIEATKLLYHPRKITVAIPIAAQDPARKIRRKAGQMIALYESEIFGSVGQYYCEFEQTSDEEVRTLLCYQQNSMKVQAMEEA